LNVATCGTALVITTIGLTNLERKFDGPLDIVMAAWSTNPNHYFDCALRASLGESNSFHRDLGPEDIAKFSECGDNQPTNKKANRVFRHGKTPDLAAQPAEGSFPNSHD
jgi:hypothetical protein